MARFRVVLLISMFICAADGFRKVHNQPRGAAGSDQQDQDGSKAKQQSSSTANIICAAREKPDVHNFGVEIKIAAASVKGKTTCGPSWCNKVHFQEYLKGEQKEQAIAPIPDGQAKLCIDSSSRFGGGRASIIQPVFDTVHLKCKCKYMDGLHRCMDPDAPEPRDLVWSIDSKQEHCTTDKCWEEYSTMLFKEAEGKKVALPPGSRLNDISAHFDIGCEDGDEGTELRQLFTSSIAWKQEKKAEANAQKALEVEEERRRMEEEERVLQEEARLREQEQERERQEEASRPQEQLEEVTEEGGDPNSLPLVDEEKEPEVIAIDSAPPAPVVRDDAEVKQIIEEAIAIGNDKGVDIAADDWQIILKWDVPGVDLDVYLGAVDEDAKQALSCCDSYYTNRPLYFGSVGYVVNADGQCIKSDERVKGSFALSFDNQDGTKAQEHISLSDEWKEAQARGVHPVGRYEFHAELWRDRRTADKGAPVPFTILLKYGAEKDKVEVFKNLPFDNGVVHGAKTQQIVFEIHADGTLLLPRS